MKESAQATVLKSEVQGGDKVPGRLLEVRGMCEGVPGSGDRFKTANTNT